MNWWQILIPSLVTIVMSINFKGPMSQKELDIHLNKITELILANYSQEEQLCDSLEKEIGSTIYAVTNSRKIKRNRYNYYKTLGILYGYAADINDRQDNKIRCYNNFYDAIETNADQDQTKYQLVNEILSSALYSTGALTFAGKAAESLLNSKIKQEHPDIYAMIIWSYKYLGNTKSATKFAYQSYYSNPDSNSRNLLELAYLPYYKFIESDMNKDGIYKYRNNLAGFEITLDSTIKIWSDLPFRENSHDKMISFLQLQMPPVKNNKSVDVFGYVTIEAFLPQFTVNDWILELEMAGMQFSDFDRTGNENVMFSREFKSALGKDNYPGEQYKGAVTIIRGNKYNYLLEYTATESTYNQFLKYYRAIEKSFNIIDTLEPD